MRKMFIIIVRLDPRYSSEANGVCYYREELYGDFRKANKRSDELVKLANWDNPKFKKFEVIIKTLDGSPLDEFTELSVCKAFVSFYKKD